MLDATEKDIIRCQSIVVKQIEKRNLNIKEINIRKITIDIMNITYSKGGSYLDIKAFAEAYFEREMYKELLN
jgi:hypothetical protein